MKLDRLAVENFRQYYGAQTVKFSRDASKTITIFNGVNGAGKTALFTALSWCFFGEAVVKPEQLMSKKAITEARPGERVTARVAIWFVHGGERYLARREVSGLRLADPSLRYDSHSTFMLMRTRPEGESREVENPTGTLNAILPENVRTYFFFDGERIDEFARPDHEHEVAHAVRNVLPIEILDRAKTHLDVIAREFRSELKNSSTGELEALLTEEEKKRQELNSIDEGIQHKQNEYRTAKKQMEGLDQRLSDIAAVKDFTIRRANLMKELHQAEALRDELNQSLRDTLNEAAGVFAKGAFQKAMGILDEKREKGEIPPGIRQQFLQDLLEEMICICGRQIEANSPEHERLIQLLNKTFPSDLETLVLEAAVEVRNALKRIDQIPDKVNRYLVKKVALDLLTEKLDAQLDEISRKLSAFDLEEVAALEKKRSAYDFAIHQLDMDIHQLRGRVEQINHDLGHLQKAIDAARKTEAKAQRLARKFVLAQQSADAIAQMVEVFAAAKRQQIQEQAQVIFQTLIWKTSHFQEIRLSDDYRLDVIDRWGLAARPDLSAGERQVLSLSFITAMARVSRTEAPLVMDTPFGRLSGEHRASITKHLPQLADQLIIFVTDEELREEARTNLEHRIGFEYRLEFDQQTSCTTIVEVA